MIVIALAIIGVFVVIEVVAGALILIAVTISERRTRRRFYGNTDASVRQLFPK